MVVLNGGTVCSDCILYGGTVPPGTKLTWRDSPSGAHFKKGSAPQFKIGIISLPIQPFWPRSSLIN